ncbi:MAG: hypothetical protein F6J95_026750 [Leptolyngbya sp. SIO1E4]|nr:hypothetical protein [Leptolyngbya sp. SIO1E4]
MSNSASFEVKTSVNLEEILSVVSGLWVGNAYHVDVLIHPDTSGRIFCILDYFFKENLEQHKMLTEVLKYLSEISEDKKIYYYRCVDFFPIQDSVIPITEINLEDLFKADFEPSIGASVEVKYLISSASIESSS